MYKVKIKDIQSKYTFKIFCAGDTSQIEQEIGNLSDLTTTAKNNLVSAINEVDGDLSAKEDKSNKVTTITSSSTDTQYPSAKLLYNQLALKENVANKTTTLSSSSTDTQYPSAKAVYDSQVAQDTIIDQTKEELDYYKTIYNALPKVSGTGESITLNNTANSVMRNELIPQMEQDSTTGKNKLDFDTFLTTSNATYTKSNGIFRLTSIGTITQKYQITLAQNSTYTISQLYEQQTPTNVRIEVLGDDTTIASCYATNQSSNVITFNSGSATNYYIRVNFSAGGGDFIFGQPQIEEGNQATSYEPYTGGTASPSPSWEQPIHTISGDNTIEVVGKNLLGLENISSTTTNGITYSVSNGEITINGTTTISAGYEFLIKSNIPTTNGTNYTLSAITEGTISGGTFSYQLRSNNTNLVERESNALPYSMDRLSGTIDKVRLYIAYGRTFTNYKIKLQFEKNNQATTYQPYQSQSKPINLGELEYNAIGDYKDEFVKVDGEWFLRKNIGKVVLNENTNVNRSTTNENYTAFYIEDSSVKTNSNLLSNYFTQATIENMTNATSLGIAVHKTLARIYFTLETSVAYDKTTCQTWLSTHNTIVYYVLATPTAITLPTTLQNQIEDIYNTTMSYTGQTNISQVNNDAPFKIYASALKEISGE